MYKRRQIPILTKPSFPPADYIVSKFTAFVYSGCFIRGVAYTSTPQPKMVMLRLTAEQYRKLPILVDNTTCMGKTYVITGGNSDMGLETARHLVAASAECVVLAVRNLDAGEDAKHDIEKTTGRKGIVQVCLL